MSRLEVREVRCRTLLHELGFGGGSEYTANFYKGCSHGCVYCYVPSLIHDEREWGTFVDVKVNAPEVLSRELRAIGRRVIFLSSATDPYQAVEARYRITRRCLEILSDHQFPVLILTRSPLVLRDLDVLKRFEWVRVGMSISSVPDRFYEPGVPPLERRIECLRRLADQGIRTWVSLAPIIPKLILADLETLIEKLSRVGVSAVTPGLLRFHGYEESKAMFEKRVGVPSNTFMKDADETMENVRELLKSRSLDQGETVLSWADTARTGKLEDFAAPLS